MKDKSYLKNLFENKNIKEIELGISDFIKENENYLEIFKTPFLLEKLMDNNNSLNCFKILLDNNVDLQQRGCVLLFKSALSNKYKFFNFLIEDYKNKNCQNTRVIKMTFFNYFSMFFEKIKVKDQKKISILTQLMKHITIEDFEECLFNLKKEKKEVPENIKILLLTELFSFNNAKNGKSIKI